MRADQTDARNSDGQPLPGASAPGTLATLTVTYNPDISELVAQLASIPAHAMKIIIDNASRQPLIGEIRALVADRTDMVLIECGDNLGLGAALNRGAWYVRDRKPSCRFLLLLDQDTLPSPSGIDQLLGRFMQLSKSHPRLGCIGPRLIDASTGLEHGFHQMTRWRWRRVFASAGSHEPIGVANLNGSGTLVPLAIFSELGGLNESLFIDHVDTEWSFRTLAAGYELLGIPDVAFGHSMGVTGIRYWLLGWRVWPYRSPDRHFFLFRNTVRLMKMPHVPVTWKAWAAVKLWLTLTVHVLFDSRRFAQAQQMVTGLRAGVASRTEMRS